jgi:hypothetical protein
MGSHERRIVNCSGGKYVINGRTTLLVTEDEPGVVELAI